MRSLLMPATLYGPCSMHARTQTYAQMLYDVTAGGRPLREVTGEAATRMGIDLEKLTAPNSGYDDIRVVHGWVAAGWGLRNCWRTCCLCMRMPSYNGLEFCVIDWWQTGAASLWLLLLALTLLLHMLPSVGVRP